MAQNDNLTRRTDVIHLRDALQLIHAKCVHNRAEMDTIHLQILLREMEGICDKALRGEPVWPGA